MSRRSNGEGTIYKRPSGRWQACVVIDGKRVYHSAGTRRECEEWRKNITSQVEKGLTLSGTKITVSAFLDSWYTIKQKNIRPATQELYSHIIRKFIKPKIGNFIVKDLSALVIQNFYNDLVNDSTGDRTIELAHTILHGALEHARKMGLVSQNWTEFAEVTRPEKVEMTVWNESQVSQFLASIDENLKPFYRLAFATGMRKSEILGLCWSDVDWASGKLMVARQIYSPVGGGWKFQPPKTDRGRRSIRLGPGLISALQHQFTVLIPQKKALADNLWQENNLVFPSSIGTPKNGNNLSRDFGILIRLFGLPQIRFHDIRHTAASIMLLHNTPAVQVAAILGQSLNVLLTTYAHFIPGGEEYPAAIMDQITTPIAIDLDPIKLQK